MFKFNLLQIGGLGSGGKSGFTLIEILVSIGILAILIAITIASFSNFYENQSLISTNEQIVSILNKARINTISSKNLLQYGVHFEENKFVFFEGAIFNASNTNNLDFDLNNALTISQISLNNASTSIVFKKLTGKTDQYGTIVLELRNNASTNKTITVEKTGIVSSQ